MGRIRGRGCGLLGSIMMWGVAVRRGEVGMVGDSTVREVLELTKVVRFTMMGHAVLVGHTMLMRHTVVMGLVMVVDSTMPWPMGRS